MMAAAFRTRCLLLLLVFLNFGLGAPAAAEEPMRIDVTIKDHRFTPAEITVPTATPVMLVIKNEDPTAEEFESSALKVEKVIAGGGSAIIRLRPLAAGQYPFIGEYHAETAHGVVISR